ncbi:MAG: hypothetical protein AAGM22_22795 [Acidobacteriota bacterium]
MSHRSYLDPPKPQGAPELDPRWQAYARQYAAADSESRHAMRLGLAPDQRAVFDLVWERLGPGLEAASRAPIVPPPVAQRPSHYPKQAPQKTEHSKLGVGIFKFAGWSTAITVAVVAATSFAKPEDGMPGGALVFMAVGALWLIHTARNLEAGAPTRTGTLGCLGFVVLLTIGGATIEEEPSNRPATGAPVARVPAADTGTFTAAQVCQAGVALAMAKSAEIMNASAASEEGVYKIWYRRPSDNSRWDLRCKLEGSRILWASKGGRWRNDPRDSVLTFRVDSDTLIVKDAYGDGSAREGRYQAVNFTESPKPNEPVYDLQVINWQWGQSSDSYVEATGQVRNLSSRRLRVKAVVNFKTADGVFIASDSGMIEYQPLMPGQTSPFRVIARRNPQMQKASIRFTTPLGESLRARE